MSAGRKKKLYFDRVNKSWCQYLIFEDGTRKKVYLGKARSRTNDPEAKKAALEKWELIQRETELNDPNALRRLRYKRKKESNHPDYRDGRGWRKIDTLGGVIDAYMEYQEGRVARGQLSAGRIKHYKYALKKFEVFVGPAKVNSRPTDPKGGAKAVINHERLKGWHKHLATKVERGELALNTVKTLFWIIKNLFDFALNEEYSVYEPRTSFMKWTDYKEYKSDNPKLAFTRDEIRTLLEYDDGRYSEIEWPLIQMLMINCGFQSRDVATLKRKHIKFDEDGMPAYIEKARTKTGEYGRFKMMRLTSLLLNYYILDVKIQEPEDHLFLTKYGHVINRVEHSKGGTTFGVDTIHRGFRHRLNKTGIYDPDNPKSVKTWRKTGAQILGMLSNDNELVQMFYLQHSTNKSVLRKHYASANQEILDDYLLKMEDYLGLTDLMEHFKWRRKQTSYQAKVARLAKRRGRNT